MSDTIAAIDPKLTWQAFIYKVPEGFTLRTEEGEAVKDVAPVQKLSGHSRYDGHRSGTTSRY